MECIKRCRLLWTPPLVCPLVTYYWLFPTPVISNCFLFLLRVPYGLARWSVFNIFYRCHSKKRMGRDVSPHGFRISNREADFFLFTQTQHPVPWCHRTKGYQPREVNANRLHSVVQGWQPWCYKRSLVSPQPLYSTSWSRWRYYDGVKSETEPEVPRPISLKLQR